jgi:alanyl-tRNA synthetase
MVDVDGVSRELCGGTHVASTAEVGLFHVTHETSSAANVRRIEALTASASAEEFRRRTQELRELAEILRVPEHEVVNAVRRMQTSLKEATKGPKRAAADPVQAEALAGRAQEISGVRVVTEAADVSDPKSLLALSDQLRQKLGDAAVVLGAATDGRVHLVANFAPSAVERGLNAGDVIRVAAEIAGGGGGGRPTLAQAGGKDPDKLPDALAAARVEIEKQLA